MATTGWLGEQTVHEWGGWGTRFTTNVYISGIRRYSDHVDVSGTIYLYCKSNGAYSVWYDWNITSWSMGNNLGQIKERTYTNNILNRSWGKNFTVRINCSNSATSATFNAGFSDSNMGGRDKYWTIYFDRYATSPSGIKSTSSYTEYSTITTSCSGINWGQGYSNRTLTCTASYTFNGKTENFTLGTWTDGATSKTVTKNDFNFPADLNVTVKWVASTNVGSSTSTSQVRVGQTYPAPNLSEVNFEGSSPSTYKLNATVTGINYGENYSKREANLYFDYTLDGISYSTLLSSISDGSTSMTVEYNATTESEPWKFIPDDEKGILRLVVDNGHQTSTKSSAQIYCQPQYEAYIVESIPDSEKEKSEIYTGKNIQIQNAPKDAPLADFKLYGDAEQDTLSGKNLAYPESSNVANNGITATYNQSTHEITITGTATTTWSIPFLHFSVDGLTLTAGTYILKQRGTLTNGKIGVNLISSGTVLTQREVNSDTLEVVFTINSDADDGYLFIGSMTANQAVSGTITVQLEAGSTATDFEPYVGGTPSPNPDYPQPIQTVTGLQTVEIQGKNLLNFQRYSNSWNGASIAVEGTSITFTADSSGVAGMSFRTQAEPLSLASGNTIVFSRTWLNGDVWERGNFYINLGLNYSDGTSEKMQISATTTSNYKREISTSKTLEKDVVSIELSGSAYEVYGLLEPITFGIQLELGSTATSYTPYSKQTYEINLGKNLFNRNDVVNGIPANTDGSIVSTTSVGRTSDYIPVSPNTVYSHTGHPLGWANVAWYKADKSFIRRDADATTVTSPSEAAYARVSCAQSDLGTCQFEAGKPTSYAPYFEPIELCKLGDYQDYIWKDGEDWKVHKDIGKYQFNGAEPWVRSGLTTPDTFVAAIATKLQDYLKVKDSNTLKSAYFIRHNPTKTSGQMNAYNGTNTAPIAFALSFDAASITSVTDAKNWISNNKPTVYSAINNPTDTVITDQTLIEQLEAISTASLHNGVNNITNIAIAPNLTGNMEIRYYTKWQDTFPATLYSNGKNGTGQFKQIRRIGTK